MRRQLLPRDLGFDVREQDEPSLFKWFLASFLFGNRISQAIAAGTWRVIVMEIEPDFPHCHHVGVCRESLQERLARRIAFRGVVRVKSGRTAEGEADLKSAKAIAPPIAALAERYGLTAAP